MERTKKVKLSAFLRYFCNKEFNPKADDIKKYIQKQVAWQLLMKATEIFDELDVDHSGQLNRAEFEKFGQMLNKNVDETDKLWETIDTDKSGQVTIVELFEWFNSTVKDKQAKDWKKKHRKITSEFSGSHPS